MKKPLYVKWFLQSEVIPPRIDTFPFESDSGTMRKVLKWGVVPLNLEGHGMNPHSLCWARTDSPVNIRRLTTISDMYQYS